MIVPKNHPLAAGYGKLQNLVVKRFGDKTILASVPDISRRKLSQKQKAANELMREAVIVARHLTGDPRQKQRACELLQVPPNKVFRAIVRQFLLRKGELDIFGETSQEKQDKQTLADLKTIIAAELPGAELFLFGQRANGAYDPSSDWDLLILTATEQPASLKWELQDKLLNATISQGTRVNLLLLQKSKWLTEPAYEAIRKRVEVNMIAVN